MALDRYLIDYLPQYMHDYLEIQEIMQTEQPEIEALWDSTDFVFANQYILEATEYGVIRWESMLSISPKDTDTLDVRKFRILTRLNQELPYTITKLKEVLTMLCGEGEFTIDLQPAQYYVEIVLAVGNDSKYNAVAEMLKKMIPANLTQYVRIMYNTHLILSQLTHQFMSDYTHEELRTEKFEIIFNTHYYLGQFTHDDMLVYTNKQLREGVSNNGE